jgi:hypothetical protein
MTKETKQQRYERRMREAGMKRIQLWGRPEDEKKIKEFAKKCSTRHTFATPLR